MWTSRRKHPSAACWEFPIAAALYSPPFEEQTSSRFWNRGGQWVNLANWMVSNNMWTARFNRNSKRPWICKLAERQSNFVSVKCIYRDCCYLQIEADFVKMQLFQVKRSVFLARQPIEKLRCDTFCLCFDLDFNCVFACKTCLIVLMIGSPSNVSFNDVSKSFQIVMNPYSAICSTHLRGIKWNKMGNKKEFH